MTPDALLAQLRRKWKIYSERSVNREYPSTDVLAAEDKLMTLFVRDLDEVLDALQAGSTPPRIGATEISPGLYRADVSTSVFASTPPPDPPQADYETVRNAVREDFAVLRAKLDELLADNTVLRQGPAHEYYRDLIHRLALEIARVNDELKAARALASPPVERFSLSVIEHHPHDLDEPMTVSAGMVPDLAGEWVRYAAALASPPVGWQGLRDLAKKWRSLKVGSERYIASHRKCADELEAALPAKICQTCQGRGWVPRSEHRDLGGGLSSGGAWNEPCPDCRAALPASPETEK